MAASTLDADIAAELANAAVLDAQIRTFLSALEPLAIANARTSRRPSVPPAASGSNPFVCHPPEQYA
ncbi:hypothetical protein [Dyella japonica]|uniref:Uncharacterized protein n=1 Tax=Dyella japonica DSM 16301 TaxID=1440762 RepID=A0A0G9H772_9GAMM|nr:hypothetical protein [Dyella japonica]KLD65453.1 hypothetical protein Y882_02745 [Dyella japonica DSM 16301]